MNVEQALKKHGYTPKPHLDQHFLCDDKIVEELVKKLSITKDDTIIEVGAGIGTFTTKLASCKKAYAIEIDKELVRILKKEIHTPNVEIIEGDAISSIGDLHFTKVLSSTPYTICESLARKLFEKEWEKAVLIVPTSFAKRLTEETSQLGLFAQAFFSIKEITAIPRDAFLPRPKTSSTAIIMAKRAKNITQELYLQQDKKLKNALLNILTARGITKNQARNKMASVGGLEHRIGRLNAKNLREAISLLKTTTFAPEQS